MVDVPEYLLERSRERRAALGGEPDGGSGGGSGGGAAESEAPAADASADAPASAATTTTEQESTDVSAAKGAGASPPAPAVGGTSAAAQGPAEEEVILSAAAQAAKKRVRVPFWAMPVLLFLPIWAFIYVGTLEEPTRAIEGILAEGHTVYVQTAACSACHTANGAGSNSGPKLSDNEVLLTFPDDPEGLGFAQHVEWVVKGTTATGVGSPYGDPERGRVGGWFGEMSAFGQSLTAREVIAVVLHERVNYSESEQATELATKIEEMLDRGDIVLPTNFSAEITAAEIQELLAPAFAAEDETE